MGELYMNDLLFDELHGGGNGSNKLETICMVCVIMGGGGEF